MSLSLQSAARELFAENLLHEIITPHMWTMNAASVENNEVPFTAITYDTRTVTPGSLLVCKGNFNPKYLEQANKLGMAAYVATNDYSAYTDAPGLIVSDDKKALSILAQAYYDHPERQLTLIGITGTKGKTTTAYYTHAIINALSGNTTALFSSVDNCVDGMHYVESDLTTPESLDAVRMMREAVNNGMKYLVMEVSSQAYKVNRVYDFHFDVAAFLNISPDHISPIEHPSFENYLWCKRQIIRNADMLVLGERSDHEQLLLEDAELNRVPVSTFALADSPAQSDIADVTCAPTNMEHTAFDYFVDGERLGSLTLAMEGDFNYANAAAALAIAHDIGMDVSDPRALASLADVRISGRMEEMHDSRSNTLAIVDYAHNFASVNALLDFVEQRYGAEHPHITLITGSAGNKAYDRREGIVKAAQDRVQKLILTAEDTDTEPIEQICSEMANNVTNEDLDVQTILDRAEAVKHAVDEARAADGGLSILLLIGKGDRAVDQGPQHPHAIRGRLADHPTSVRLIRMRRAYNGNRRLGKEHMIIIERVTPATMEEEASKHNIELPIEQTSVWADFQADINGRRPWGCLLHTP